ncbi:acyl-CoA synthetase [Rhodococcus phenolicus]|uniref:acyl-CoA synthetase n=1 Tax=Rhodococcus phenolicus TaxID=263849 RepID=UPI00082E8068|nr:acyl-CoA synthetase [Rhodococcus phenolicus]
MSLNLADLFEAIADAVPDRTALICGDGRLTYRELDAGANRLAHHLTSAGIVAGDHIGLYMRNSTEFVEALLAILKIRAVPININYRYVDAELAYLFANAELAAVVADGEFAARTAAVLPRTPTVRHVVTVGPAADVDWDTVTTADFHKAVAAQSGERDFAPRSGDDRFIIYTGGTTGMPKGVMWRAEDFFHAALSGGNPMGDPHSDIASVAAQAANMPAMTWMLTAPLIHGAAMYSMFSAFCLGTSQVVVPSFEAKKVLALIERERVMTMTIVGDAMARPLADAIAEHGAEYDLSSLFVVGSGGALFSKNVREQLVSLLPNVMVRDGFGSSESGIDGDLSIGEDGRMRIAAKPTVKVVDERMRPIEPGSGEIGYIARAGHVPLGYWGDPEKTAATFPVIDGVRMSILGDMASVDEDGTIVLLGRGSMCINTGGEKVYPEEVEMAIKSHPSVMDVLVAGVEDERYGQRVGAVVQAREGHRVPELDELIAHVAERIARYKVPRVVVGVDSIVRSPAGKADYRWAKTTLEAQK